MFGKRLLVLGALSTCLLAAGCSSGTPTVSQTDVETQVKEALAKQVGQTPKSISCPSSLAATVGATQRCTLTTDDGATLGLTVKVTSVDNGTAKFSVEVDSASPAPGAASSEPMTEGATDAPEEGATDAPTPTQ